MIMIIFISDDLPCTECSTLVYFFVVAQKALVSLYKGLRYTCIYGGDPFGRRRVGAVWAPPIGHQTTGRRAVWVPDN